MEAESGQTASLSATISAIAPVSLSNRSGSDQEVRIHCRHGSETRAGGMYLEKLRHAVFVLPDA